MPPKKSISNQPAIVQVSNNIAQGNDNNVLEEDFFHLTLVSNAAGNLQSASNYRFTCNPPLDLTGRWGVALSNYSFWNTIPNITAALGNNIIGYRTYGSSGPSTSITIPDGSYGLSGLTAIIQSAMGNRNVELAAYPNLLNTVANLSSGYQLDLTLSKINLLLGFNSEILTPSSTAFEQFVSENYANFSPNLSSVNFVIEPVVDESRSYFNGNQCSVLYTTGIQVEANEQQAEAVFPFQFIRCGVQQLNNITVRITDQNFVDLNFSQGTDLTNNPASVKLYFVKFA